MAGNLGGRPFHACGGPEVQFFAAGVTRGCTRGFIVGWLELIGLSTCVHCCAAGGRIVYRRVCSVTEVS